MLKSLFMGAALLVAVAGTASAQDKAAVCSNGIKKLETGIQVIGATDAQKASAQNFLNSANAAMADTNYNACIDSAAKGIVALNAG